MLKTMLRKTIIASALLVSLPAIAGEPNKIDFTQPVLDQHGNLAHQTDDKSPIITIGDVAAAALLRPPAQDARMQQQPDPIKLAKRAILAQRIESAKDAALTAEEISEIKSSIAIFPPITVLRVLEAIDPASVK